MKQGIIIGAILLGGLVTYQLTTAVLNTVDSIPLLPSVFELIGLIWTIQFVRNSLLTTTSREELGNKVAASLEEVVGKPVDLEEVTQQVTEGIKVFKTKVTETPSFFSLGFSTPMNYFEEDELSDQDMEVIEMITQSLEDGTFESVMGDDLEEEEEVEEITEVDVSLLNYPLSIVQLLMFSGIAATEARKAIDDHQVFLNGELILDKEGTSQSPVELNDRILQVGDSVFLLKNGIDG